LSDSSHGKEIGCKDIDWRIAYQSEFGGTSAVSSTTTFHGDANEAASLNRALERNCTCEVEESSGARVSCCPGHDMLIHDQRALDGLLFMRVNAATLRREEGLN